MAVACGTDIISVGRIEKSITDLGDVFKKRIYTDEEISYCESRRMSKYQSYAARFAAKEAIFKAISPESAKDISWRDAEVVKKENGKPVFKFYGKLAELVAEKDIKSENIDLTLSHDEYYAVATVVILDNK